MQQSGGHCSGQGNLVVKKQQKTLGCGAVCHFRNILHSDCHLSVPFLSELGAIKHLEGWEDDLVGEVLPAKVQCLEHT